MSENLPQADPSNHPIIDFSDADLAALLKRATIVTAVLGVVLALFLWMAIGWRSAALFAVGAAISVASIYEWGRLIRLINESMDQNARKKTPRGVSLVVTLFMLRLLFFGAAIYVSLKCFRVSPLALACGLALAIVGLGWEALRQLRT